jgi:hypothetical protein
LVSNTHTLWVLNLYSHWKIQKRFFVLLGTEGGGGGGEILSRGTFLGVRSLYKCKLKKGLNDFFNCLYEIKVIYHNLQIGG